MTPRRHDDRVKPTTTTTTVPMLKLSHALLFSLLLSSSLVLSQATAASSDTTAKTTPTTTTTSSKGSTSRSHGAGAAPIITLRVKQDESVDHDIPLPSSSDSSSSLFFSINTQPRHGVASILDGRKIRYLPAPAFVGRDEFTYQGTYNNKYRILLLLSIYLLHTQPIRRTSSLI